MLLDKLKKIKNIFLQFKMDNYLINNMINYYIFNRYHVWNEEKMFPYQTNIKFMSKKVWKILDFKNIICTLLYYLQLYC